MSQKFSLEIKASSVKIHLSILEQGEGIKIESSSLESNSLKSDVGIT